VTVRDQRSLACLQSGINGYQKVEEYDPMEAVRQRSGSAALEDITSLDDELRAVHQKVDIHNFDYVPVPRDDEDEE
jgi:hypothetical protein